MVTWRIWKRPCFNLYISCLWWYFFFLIKKTLTKLLKTLWNLNYITWSTNMTSCVPSSWHCCLINKMKSDWLCPSWKAFLTNFRLMNPPSLTNFTYRLMIKSLLTISGWKNVHWWDKFCLSIRIRICELQFLHLNIFKSMSNNCDNIALNILI